MQDFSNASDIDWSKPVAELDKQLYAKYGLSQEEIDYLIENECSLEEFKERVAEFVEKEMD